MISNAGKQQIICQYDIFDYLHTNSSLICIHFNYNRNDWLELHNGDSISSPIIGHKISLNTIPKPIYVQANVLFVHFHGGDCDSFNDAGLSKGFPKDSRGFRLVVTSRGTNSGRFRYRYM